MKNSFNFVKVHLDGNQVSQQAKSALS